MMLRKMICSVLLFSLVSSLLCALDIDGGKWNIYGNGEVKLLKDSTLSIADQRTDGGAGVYRQFPVNAKENIKFSCKIQSAGQKQGSILMQIRFLPTKKLIQEALTVQFNQRFDDFSLSATVPEGNNEAEVYLYTDNPGKSTYLVKDIKLELTKPVDFKNISIPERAANLILRRDNKAVAAVIASRDPDLAEAAAGIARTLQLPIFNDKDKIPAEIQTYILVGWRNNNGIISDLYNRYYCIADLYYPGEHGYQLRTIFNPAGNKLDYLLVSGSNVAGVSQAAERLLEIYQKLSSPAELPHIWDIKLDERYILPASVERADTFDQSCGYGPRYFGWNTLSRYMALFYQTGNERYARDFLRLAFPATPEDIKEVNYDPVAFRIQTDPIGAPYHYNAPMMAVYWNMIADHPFFTPADREKVIRAFFRQFSFLSSDPREGHNVHLRLTPQDRVGSRHDQWAAVSFYTLSRYLNKIAPCPEFVQAMRGADNSFAALKKYPWIEGEGGNLTWFASGMEPIPYYLLIAGEYEKYPEKNLREIFGTLETLTGNFPGDRILNYIPSGFLRRMAYLLKDNAPLEMEKLQPSSAPGWKFRLGQSFAPNANEYPKNTAAAARLWHINKPSAAELTQWTTTFPDKYNAFSLASWRADHHGGDLIIIDGFLEKELRQPLHAMNIFTLTVDRIPLLAGYQNQLWARADGIAMSKMARAAHLDYMVNLGEMAAFASTLPISRSANWQRLLFKLPHLALLADRLSETSPGKKIYDLKINFEHGPDLERKATARAGQIELNSSQSATANADLWVDAQAAWSSSPSTVEALLMTSSNCILFKGTAPHQKLMIPFKTAKPVDGEMILTVYAYTDRGCSRVYIDGKEVAAQINMFDEKAKVKKISLGKINLPAGKHELILETLTPSPVDKINFIQTFISLSVDNKKVNNPGGTLVFADEIPVKFEDRDVVVQDKLTGEMTILDFPTELSGGCDKYFFTLLSSYPANEITMRRLRSNLVEITGRVNAIVCCGKIDQPAWQGDLIYYSSDFLGAMHASRIGELVTASSPIDLAWEINSGAVHIGSAQAATVTLAGREFKINAGITCLTVNKINSLPGLNLKPELNDFQAKINIAAANQQGRVLSGEIIMNSKNYPTAILEFNSLVAVAAGRELIIIDSKGEIIKVLALPAEAAALTYASRAKLLVAGCGNEEVVAFDAEKWQEKWKFTSEMAPEMSKTGAVWYFKSEHPGIWGLSSGIFINNEEQIFAGSASTVEVISTTGRLISRQPVFWGPVWQLALFPLNKEPRLAVASAYPGSEFLSIFNPKMEKKIGYNTPPPTAEHFNLWASVNRTGIIVEDLNQDGKSEIISGLNGFWNRIVIWNDEGVPQTEVSFGPGYSIRAGKYGRQQMEKKLLIDLRLVRRKLQSPLLVAALEESIIAFDAALKPVWRQLFNSTPSALYGGNDLVVAGTRDGNLKFFNSQGAALGEAKFSSAIIKIAQCGEYIIVATRDGEIAKINLKNTEEKK